MIKKKDLIYVAGHSGLLGSAIVKNLKNNNFKNILTIEKQKLNLLNQEKTYLFLKKKKPKMIFIAAGEVGGIGANINNPGLFIFNNLQIQNNLINGAKINGIKNIIFIASSAIYPKNITRPLKETDILKSSLEKSVEPYAIAKIAGIKMCEAYNKSYNLNYKSLIPCNSYGPNDNFDEKTSHFFPSLLIKAIKLKRQKDNQKKFILWGNGKARRELVHIDDIADACIYFMNKKSESIINIGLGSDKTILNYAKIIMKILNIKNKIHFDLSKPSGVKRKLLDISLAKKYGWKPKISLEHGIKEVLNQIRDKF